MSATIAGALKAHLESQGWRVPWFRDGAMPGQRAPFGTIQEGIGYADDQHGDLADPAAHVGETELVQVDLYLPARKPGQGRAGHAANAEDYQLPRLLRRALRGWDGVYGSPPQRVYGTRITGGQRWPIEDNVVRFTLTISCRRDG